MSDRSHLIWTDIKNPETVYEGPIFDVVQVLRKSADGRKAPFIRVESPEWVTIIPIFRDSTGKKMCVMEEQFRHGAGRVTREFPAGLVEPGELCEIAAMRELEEETGIIADRITLIGECSPNSAIMSNRSHFYLAEDISFSGHVDFDENEQIELVTVPLEEVIKDMGTGIYDNGIMMIALGYLLKEAARRPEVLK